MKILTMVARLRSLWNFRAEGVHDEISDELRFHLEMKAADLEPAGIANDEARAKAQQSFGSVTRIHEQGYDVRGGGVLEDIWGDTRFAIRLLRKQWTKTCVLVTTLALGIGVNTAVFSVVRSVLLQPLPFPDAEQLVVLHQSNHGQTGGVSYPNFQDWSAPRNSFEGMAVYSAESATLTGNGDASTVYGAVVSHAFFDVLGIRPLIGRLFGENDDRFAGANVAGPVVISTRLWRSRFGESTQVLGQKIQLDGKAFEVVGVIPGRLSFPIQNDRVDYWKTVGVDADPRLYGGSIPVSRGYPRYDGAIARLRGGMTLTDARSEMKVVAADIAHQHPKATSANEVAVIPELEEVVGYSSRTMILVLYGTVFCVLLVACLNVANILFVDALARRREFSMRVTLGAPLAKLIRQLLVESTLLSIAGGLVGLLVSWFVLRLFVVLAPTETPRLGDIRLQTDALFYVAAVSVFAGLLFAALPIASIRRLSLDRDLRSQTRSVTKIFSFLQPGSVLICVQIVLGMILTCCAGVLVDNFREITQAERGFNPHGVLTASITVPIARYGQSSEKVLNYYRSLLQAVRALPGVESATLSEVLPLSGRSNSTTFSVVGASTGGKMETNLRFVEASYFKTLQIPLRIGRTFQDTDGMDRTGIMIVNEAFAKRFLQNPHALGHQVRLGWGGEAAKQIVGIVGDIRHDATSPQTVPEAYVPFTQFPLNDMSLVIRASGDPYALSNGLRTVARQLDSAVPVDRIRSLDDYLLLSASQQRFMMWLLVGFAALSLMLSGMGLYGILSDAVLARSHEFGIRLALGSSAARVVALVLSHGVGLTAAGIVIGGFGSVFAIGLLRQWLFEAGSQHGVAMVISGCFLLAGAILACVVPARRAALLDPVTLLRGS